MAQLTPSPRFWRSTLVSLFTTALDVMVLTGAVELLRLDPAWGAFCGSLVGATANFLINRSWTFDAARGHAGGQVARYLVAQAGAALLNAGGVGLLADVLGVPYLGAKAVIAALVYIAWNYPINRHWVFRLPPAAAVTAVTAPP